MKKPIRLALISVALGAASHAAPFMAIGDGAELFLTGSLGVRADDNVFLSSNSESDLIFDITPGAEITFGKNSQVQGALTLGLMFSNYSDNSDLNTNLFSGDFVSRYDDGKLKLGFNVGFHELNQNTVDIRRNGRLTRRDVFTAGANAEVEISQISSVGGGIAFRHENFKPLGFTDSDELSVPLNFYYKWTPKVDLSLGYRYRDYQVDLGQDSTDHFFNVGARGEFSPKLTGTLAVGVNTRELDGRDPVTGRSGGDDTILGVDASFSYEISPKTNFQFGLANDFGTSPQGQQQENFTVNGMIITKVSEEWSINGGLSYRKIDYNTRTDDYWEAQLGTTFIVNQNVRLVGAYVYRNYETDVRGFDFKNNVFSVAANLRY